MPHSEYSAHTFGESAGVLAGGWGPQFESERYAMQHIPPAEAAIQAFRDYARQRPEVVALWALGIGFVLGWRMKPW